MFIRFSLVFCLVFASFQGRAIEISPVPRYVLKIEDAGPNRRRLTLSDNGVVRPLGRGNGEFYYTDLKKYVDSAVEAARFGPTGRLATQFATVTGFPCAGLLAFTAAMHPTFFFSMTPASLVDLAIIPVTMLIFLIGEEKLQLHIAATQSAALGQALEDKVALPEDKFLNFMGQLEGALYQIPTWSARDGQPLR